MAPRPPTGEQTLSGLRKAAILLVQMGSERAARVLSQLRDDEVEVLTAEIARLRDVDPDIADEVVEEFQALASMRRYAVQGGLGYAQELLEASQGRERARELLARLEAATSETPFHFLHKADPRQLLSFLTEEHPQTIALVLAHLRAEQSSTILSGLGPELQADVAHRIAVMDRTSPGVIRTVETQLARKMSSLLGPGELAAVGGVGPLVDIINRADRPTEKLILAALEQRNPELAEEVRSRMFMFEDIVSLDDRAVQLVLRQVESGDLATALKGARPEVHDKVLSNLSERAAQNLTEEIELLGPVRLRTVEEAQAKVVAVIRALEESGQIVVRRGEDDELVE